MSRAKTSVQSNRRHKKLLSRAKGFQGKQNRIYRNAKEALLKAGAHAYRGRKERKRTFRRLWITRLSAAIKPFGLTYSQFIHQQNLSGIQVNRKLLSEIAIKDPESFTKIVEEIKRKD